MFARATSNIQNCIVVIKLMEINFSMFLNFFDVISKNFRSFLMFFSMFCLSILFLFYIFAFLCVVVLCFVIDPDMIRITIFAVRYVSRYIFDNMRTLEIT